MNDRTWQVILTILGGVIAGVIGLLTGFVLNKWQRAAEREAGIEDRKRKFLAFLIQMRGQTNWVYPAGQFSVFFKNVTPNFLHAASFIQKDFTAEKQAAFGSLVEGISNYEHGKSENQNQERILNAIDKLAAFVEGN